MSAFQILAVSVLGGVFLRDLLKWSRSPASLLVRVLRLAVWAGSGVAITIPSLIQEVAQLLGIGRGADVVLYLFVLAFLWVSFFLYARCLRLEREITALTRHMAIRDAVREPASGEPSTRSEEVGVKKS
jgi:hypothetical protein